MRADAAGSSILTPHEQQILLAVCRAALPAGRHLPSPSPQAVADVGRYIDSAGDAGAQVYRGILWAVEASAWLAHRRSFTALTDEQATDMIERWRTGTWPRRNALRVLVTPVKVAHYGNAAFYEKIGCVWERPVASEARPRWMGERVLTASDAAGEELECDVVVIGTGAGGAVVAKELAEAGLAVVMLEEGDYHTRADFSRPVIETQRRLYRDGGACFSVGNSAIWIPTGISVGGTTTINSGTCFRTPDRVLESWRHDFGLDDITPDRMAPHYERVEEIIGVAPTPPALLGGSARVVARGCEALGYKHGPLARNAPGCDGQGVCVFGCPTDAKRSTNVSYIPLALQRGATLVTGVRAEEVLRAGGRAVGVVARSTRGDEKVTVRARAVVVACGTLLTPLFLAKNRAGGSSGQLGKNLSIHPASGVFAIFDERIDGYRGVPQSYQIAEFADEGLLFEGAFTPPDVGAAGITTAGRRFVDVMDDYDRLACFGIMIEDTSRGTVRPGLRGRPLITYYLNDHDVARLKRGAEILMRVFLAAGARYIVPCIHGFDEVRSEEDLARFRRAKVSARDFELSAFHPLGTARMGASPSRSVVGPDHQVHDTPGLYVVDGSAVPSSLAVNPQLTIMALATRAATLLAERLS